MYLEDIDTYVSDMELLCENREMKNLIFVSNNAGRYLKQLKNGVPVKDYTGNKKDYSCVALARYLKGFIRVKDVREKI